MPASRPTVRPWDPEGPDADAVGRLVGACLRQAEREQAAHLRGESIPLGAKLPARYRPEVDDPATAYAAAAVVVAELDDAVAGVVVLVEDEGALEVRRLWTAPEARGRGVGSALLDAAIAHGPGPLRLSVWDWCSDALGLCASRGFQRVASRDERPRMVCMERVG